MEVGYLWLIPISIFLNVSLYQVQKHYLIKWFCRTFLTSSVQLECDLKAKQSSTNGTCHNTSNGVAKSNGVSTAATKNSELHVHHVHEEGTYYGKKIVTDGEVNGIAMENVGSFIAAVTALVSAIVMIQTRHDVVNGRSPFLIPWCHIAAWYFVVDLFNMYDAFSTKNDISHLSLFGRFSAYVKTKWPYVVHHVVLFTFGYTVVVNDSVRGYKGDFFVASIIGEDFSNPLVNSAKVLKMLGQDKTTVYIFNGFLLVAVFFVVRILNIPIVLLIYAAQCHNWNLIAALRKLKLICYFSICLQYTLQFYWFIKIVKLALMSLAKIRKQSSDGGAVHQKKTD